MAVASIPGVDVLIKTGGTPTAILGQRNATLNIETDMLDMTVKPASYTDLPKLFMASWYEWSVDCDGLLQAGGSGGIATLVTAQLAGSEVDVELTVGSSGEKFTGSAIYKSISAEGPHDKEGTFKATLQGTGSLTPTVGT